MPMNLTDLLNAKSLNKYYAGVKGTTLVEAMFPAGFSNNFDINVFVSLDGGTVEVLQSSQLDADVMFRDWDLKTATKGDKQFFREAMTLDEKRRKELLEILNKFLISLQEQKDFWQVLEQSHLMQQLNFYQQQKLYFQMKMVAVKRLIIS